MKTIYDNGDMKIEVAPIVDELIKTNKEIAKLDMHQRIKILEYVTGRRDVGEITEKKVFELVTRVIHQQRTTGQLPSELNPSKWNLPSNPNRENKSLVDEIIETNEEIAKLDMHQRIKILEYVTGRRDVSEITEEKVAELVACVISQRLTTGQLPSELNPSKWNLPSNPNHENKSL